MIIQFSGVAMLESWFYSKMTTTYSVLSTKSIYLSLFELLGLKSTKFHNVWSKYAKIAQTLPNYGQVCLMLPNVDKLFIVWYVDIWYILIFEIASRFRSSQTCVPVLSCNVILIFDFPKSFISDYIRPGL